jgi:hypothetical protein
MKGGSTAPFTFLLALDVSGSVTFEGPCTRRACFAVQGVRASGEAQRSLVGATL